MQELIQAISPKDLLLLVMGAMIGPLIALLITWLREMYSSRRIRRGLPYDIQGDWFSLEYVPKPGDTSEQCNVVTKVKIAAQSFGRWRVVVTEQLDGGGQQNERTEWYAIGRIRHHDTLIGWWESAVPNSKRFGAVAIKFMDNGRGLGYWIGPSRHEYPVYGYWVLSRYLADIESIRRSMLGANLTWTDALSVAIRTPPQA